MNHLEAPEQPRRGRPPKVREEVSQYEATEATMSEEAPMRELAPEERTERRRKDGDGDNMGLRLAIPDWVYEKYPRQHYKLRWLTDEPGRVAMKHREDWDRVEGVSPVPGSYDRNGNPASQVLFVKRMEWVLEDRKHAETRRRDIEQQMERGRITGKGDDAGTSLAEDITYADESNRLR